VRLHRIELRGWRGLEHLVLDELADDLNLVAGPNMAGKSRLFGALHAAFFESHRGAAAYKKAYRSWTGDAAPEVEICFSIGGERYTLHKRFLDKPFAQLETKSGNLAEEEAEARLAEIVGAGPSSGRRGPAATKDKGLWPLVWVEQHHAHDPPHDHITDAARTAIQDVLASEVGAVAAGPRGQRILERARQEAARYWTANNWQATGELRAAQKHADAEAEAVTAARERRDAAHARADELGEKRVALTDQSGRLATLRARKKELDATIQGAEELERERQDAVREVAETMRMLDEARRALAAREQLEATLAAARDDRDQTAAALAALRDQLAERKETLGDAETAIAEAEEAWKQARQALQHAAASARSKALDRSVGELRGRVDKVTQLDEERRTAEDALARILVTKDDVAAIERSEKQVLAARARLEAASARLSIEALTEVDIDGAPHAAGQRWSVIADGVRTVRIGDVATVTVEPGGEGLERWGDALRDADTERGERLAAAGVDSLSAAREALAQRDRHERERDSIAARIEELAPNGLGALRDAFDSARRERDALGEVPEDALDEDRARELEDAARQRVGTERSARDAIKETVSEARTEEATLRTKLEQAGVAVKDSEDKLAAQPAGPELDAAAAARQDALGKAERRVEQLESELEERGVEAAREENARVERGIAKLEETRTELQDRVNQLKGELNALGGERLHEQLQEAEARQTDAERALARVAAQAGAAKRLVLALEEARSQVQQQLWAPIRSRIQPYLARILPEHEVLLSEKWELLGVQTGGRDMPLEDLSGGTHEQLSVIVRVALAEAIAGDDRLPLILDDPLVHSDAERHNAMLGVLNHAARRLQVIVLTCHQADFDALGETRRYLLDRAGRVTRV